MKRLKTTQLWTLAFVCFFLSVALTGCKTTKKGADPEGIPTVTPKPRIPWNEDTGIQAEQWAKRTLIKSLGDNIREETVIMYDGESTLDEMPCWKFVVGVNRDGRFLAEDRYAVTDDGEVHLYSAFDDSYTPLWEINSYQLTTEQEWAETVLINTLGGDLAPGYVLMYDGESRIYGISCYLFVLGTDDPGKFTAKERYAVSDGGTVYWYDVMGDEYVILEN
jgi:hypothetical protein